MRRNALVLALLLAVLAAAFVALARSLRVEPPAPIEVAETPAGAAGPAGVAPPVVAPSEADGSGLAAASEERARSALVAPADPAAERREEVPAELLAEGWWVEGRVRFPDRTPLDELAYVIARGRKFDRGEYHRVQVAPDGTFRVAFERGTRRGRLALEARYAYLAEPVTVMRGASARVELAPSLGSWVRGTCALGPGLEGREAELAGATVSLRPDWREGLDLGPRSSRLDARLAFAFGGVPAGISWSVHARLARAVSGVVPVPDLAPGSVHEVELPLKPGIVLAGRVVDERGDPVEGARFELSSRGGRRDHPGEVLGLRETGADGAFELTGIEDGAWVVRAHKAGHVDAELDCGTVADGATRSDLVLRLTDGLAVEGTVRDPSGRPLAGATIAYRRVGADGGDSWLASEDRVRSAEDGSFAIRGLEDARYRLHATARAPGEREAQGGSRAERADDGARSADEAAARDLDAPAASGGAGGDEPHGGDGEDADGGDREGSGEPGRDRSGGPRSRARPPRAGDPRLEVVREVDAPARGVELVLGEGAAIEGFVVDDRGGPVAEFTVAAVPADRANAWNRREGRVSTRVEDEDGRFELRGLRAGDWELEVEAKGHGKALPERVRVPHAGPPPTLRLPRAAALRGIVLGPDGRAFEGARIELEDQGPRMRFDLGERESATSGAEGRFELEGVDPRPQTVRASATGLADSEAIAIAPAPGDALEGLVLALRRGGTLALRVLDEDGRPEAGREAWLSHEGSSRGRQAGATDGDGRLYVPALAPGRWHVVARPSVDFAKLVEEHGEAKAQRVYSERSLSANVEIREGETTELVLGGAPAAAIRVHGVVRCAGERVEGAIVRVMAGGRRIEGWRERSTHSDARGEYELALPGAGAWQFTVARGEGGASSGSRHDVPEGASHRLDLELPAGAIAGRVVGADGDPVAGAWVSLREERGSRARRSSWSNGHARSGERGEFAFDGLVPATYSVTVGQLGGGGLPGTKHAIATRGGLVIGETTRIEGLELRLAESCAVEGVVIGPDGKPFAGAAVFVRGTESAPLPEWSTLESDSSGRFRVEHLPPGPVTLFAKTNELASHETAPVIASAGEAARVELALRPATRLYVQVLKEDGSPVGAQMRAFDAQGRDVGGFAALGAPLTEVEGAPPGFLIAVLPPGTYRVTATNHDGVTLETSVELDGEAMRGVELRFGS